jgi:hypothetical protein
MNKEIATKFEEVVYNHFYYFFVRMLGRDASVESQREWMHKSNQANKQLIALGELYGHDFLHKYMYQSYKGYKIADRAKQAAREYLEGYTN